MYQSQPTSRPTPTVKAVKPCCIRQSKVPGLPAGTAVGAEGGGALGTCGGCFFFFLVFFLDDDAFVVVAGAPGPTTGAPRLGGGGGGTALARDSPEQEAHASQSHRLV